MTGPSVRILVNRRAALLALGVALVFVGAVIAIALRLDLALPIGVTSVVAGVVCIAAAKPRVKPGLGTLAAALYVTSLFLPAIVFLNKPILGGEPSPQNLPGLGCLLWGWAAPHLWIANPLAAVAAVLHVVDRPRGAFVWASLALIAAALSPLLLGDQLVRIEVGYGVWVASLACLALGCWRAKRALDRDPSRV